MNQSVIENKTLGINSNDINDSNDLNELNNWKLEIKGQVLAAKGKRERAVDRERGRDMREETLSYLKRTKHFIECQEHLINLIENRIRTLTDES